MSSGAPFETGTPIRQPATALLCVDSADAGKYVNKTGTPQKYITGGFRSDTNTPADIQINKQTPLLFGYMTRLSLTEVAMEWSTPNVNIRNNSFTVVLSEFSEATTEIYRVALEQNFYLPDELATALQTQLNDLDEDATWTVVYDARKNNFTINVEAVEGSPKTFAWSPLAPGFDWGEFTVANGNVASPAGVTVPPGIVQDDLTYVMGFTVPYSYITQAGNDPSDPAGLSYEVEGGYAPMCYTPYVDIVSNIITKNQNIQDNDSTLRNGTAKLARIYLRNENIDSCFDTDEAGAITKCNIVGCRPFSFRREFQTPKVIMWNTTENVDVIDLQVIDRLGFPIYIETVDPRTTVEGQIFAKFGNTANFQFTIQATET
jgi:hypothetical protein